jgi:hypothetical protein
VKRLTSEGLEGSINLPLLSNQLYRSARWLRIFVARPVKLDRKAVMKMALMPEPKVRASVANGEALIEKR